MIVVNNDLNVELLQSLGYSGSIFYLLGYDVIWLFSGGRTLLLVSCDFSVLYPTSNEILNNNCLESVGCLGQWMVS